MATREMNLELSLCRALNRLLEQYIQYIDDTLGAGEDDERYQRGIKQPSNGNPQDQTSE